ncbi:hypothetical protein AB0C69_33845 [Actinomadura sp. NPDC048032]|uniref:hypothetical protein n=1 Tax=Actinomadura sp. NPDC048032 TaxID=3155747 RepID=UPI0033E6607D
MNAATQWAPQLDPDQGTQTAPSAGRPRRTGYKLVSEDPKTGHAELLGGGVVQLGDPPLGRVRLPQRGRQLGVPLPPERQHQPDRRAPAAGGQAGAHGVHPELGPLGSGRGIEFGRVISRWNGETRRSSAPQIQHPGS